MNYKLNFSLLLLVFSIVTYNVCMAYQDLEDVNVQGKFQQIGLLDTPKNFIVPPRKPLQTSEMASIE